MNLTVLASGAGWHIADLRRAACARNVNVGVMDFRDLNSSFAGETVLVRSMPPGSLEQVIFRMDLLHAAAANGAVVLNPPRALECCIDKYLTTVRLQNAGLPVPPTWCGQRAEDAIDAITTLGGDVVIKPLFGSEGRGIVRVSDPETAWRVCHAIERTGGVLYLQKFLHHDWDVRAFVVGDTVIAAMKRLANGGWRANIAQGGRAEALQLRCDVAELAVAAAGAVECPIAGVDLLPTEAGWSVIEVNAVPGWRALSAACSVDVAGAILDYIAARAKS